MADQVEVYTSDKEAYDDLFGDDEAQDTAEPAPEADEDDQDADEPTDEAEEPSEDVTEETKDEAEEKPEKRGDPEVPLKHLRAENKELKAAQAASQQEIQELRAMLLNQMGEQKSPEIQRILDTQEQRDMEAAVSVLPELPTNNHLADIVMGLKERGYTYATAAKIVSGMLEGERTRAREESLQTARQEVAKRQATKPPAPAARPGKNDALKARLNSSSKTVRERAMAEDLGYI